MRSHFLALATAAVVMGTFAACEETAPVGSDSSDITEWATAKDRDDAFTTKYVIADICEEIYGAGIQADQCKDDHGFTLVESKFSTHYGYLKAIEDNIESPIEVGRTVEVVAPNDAVFEATLLRQLDESFHLRWTVLDVKNTGGSQPAEDVHDHILEVAAHLGEYVDFDDHDDVHVTTWEALPDAVKLECESEMLFRAELNSEHQDCSGSADVADMAEIHLNGAPVGYICGIVDVFEECSIWDGSGAWLFIDGSGSTVTETEWGG